MNIKPCHRLLMNVMLLLLLSPAVAFAVDLNGFIPSGGAIPPAAASNPCSTTWTPWSGIEPEPTFGSSRFMYTGGVTDGFALPGDAANPSPGLVNFMTNFNAPTTQSVYDAAALDVDFGDSFHLEPYRTVCYATLRLVVGTAGSNDALYLGSASALDLVHVFELSGADLSDNLASGTWHFSKDSLDALNRQLAHGDADLDLYLQDDTAIDFVRLHVWYANP